MSGEKITILYVDDEPNNLLSFKATFRLKYRVVTAESAAAALNLIEQEKPVVIITDQRMPGMTGVAFLESILEKHPHPMRILLTGYTDFEALTDAVNKGKIYHYLNKPWKADELEQVIDKAIEEYQTQEAARAKTDEISTINKQLEFLLRQKLLS